MIEVVTSVVLGEWQFLLRPGLFGGIGSGEIVIILVVLLLLFGPKQLPELAKTIGNALRGIRNATDEMKEEIGLDELIDPRPRRSRYYRPPRPVSHADGEMRKEPPTEAEPPGVEPAAQASLEAPEQSEEPREDGLLEPAPDDDSEAPS